RPDPPPGSPAAQAWCGTATATAGRYQCGADQQRLALWHHSAGGRGAWVRRHLAARLKRMSGARILLIVGGGIAAYKACELIRLLRKAGMSVRCVLTAGGAQFVTP